MHFRDQDLPEIDAEYLAHVYVTAKRAAARMQAGLGAESVRLMNSQEVREAADAIRAT